MVNVSEKFKALAMDNGREVSCKIVAGNVTYLDDKLIDFDFDDVIHPNWYTIGTTCANRFSFSVRYSNELSVQDEVRPYISFDGEEWCPLGVFYVARRYVRGNYASIICYDRMYSLETEYVPKVSAPTNVKAMLEDICENYGIECAEGVSEYAVEVVPTGETVRDMLGYIAGIACGNAKFDREGKLRIKRYSQTDKFMLPAKNCMDYSRYMTETEIKHLVIDTGEETIEAGSGGDIVTLELYNPLFTQRRAENIITIFQVMRFYGADIEMQGLPFLEAGDHIYMIGEDETLYPIAISEIEYHYDGGLTARLYSRTRSYTDAIPHQDDLTAALEQIKASLGNICLKGENSEDIVLTADGEQIANFEFKTRISGLFAQVDLNFTIDGAGTAELRAYVNGKLVRDVFHETEGEKELIHFYFMAENLPKGENIVYVSIRSINGNMTIKSGELVSTLVCRGGAGGRDEKLRDREMMSDAFGRVAFPYTFYTKNAEDRFETALEITETGE